MDVNTCFLLTVSVLCQLLLRDPGVVAIANVYQALNSVTETSDATGSFSLNRVRSHLTSSGTPAASSLSALPAEWTVEGARESAGKRVVLASSLRDYLALVAGGLVLVNIVTSTGSRIIEGTSLWEGR